MYFSHMGSFGFFGMGFFWILFIGIIVWLILQNRNAKTDNGPDPERLVQIRYAKGEINKKEYDEMIRKLRG